MNFEKPHSVWKEKENWRNKGETDDVLLNQSLKFASTFAVQSSNKRKMEKENRKPSKYFKPCPDIHIRQNLAAFGKRYTDVMLLKNGSKFQKHIEIGDRRYIFTNTCPFDTIAQILAVGANDCIKYFNHLELSTNDTCGFILVFMDSGTKDYVYAQRCQILKDFVDPAKPPNNFVRQKHESPFLLRSVDVFSNVVDMWNFLMSNEPSMYRIRECRFGFREVEKVFYLRINHTLIYEKGFRTLQKAILDEPNILQSCNQENCDIFTSIKTELNAHVLIEADVRDLKDVKKSKTCKTSEFPVYLTLHGETFRFVEILTLDVNLFYVIVYYFFPCSVFYFSL